MDILLHDVLYKKQCSAFVYLPKGCKMFRVKNTILTFFVFSVCETYSCNYLETQSV
jgi:hypothetical protein